jgi:hypothetical protein
MTRVIVAVALAANQYQQACNGQRRDWDAFHESSHRCLLLFILFMSLLSFNNCLVFLVLFKLRS